MATCSMCPSDPSKEKVSLFRIPINEWTRKRWSEACQRTLLDRDRICEKHFVKTDYINQPGTYCKGKTRLFPSAVPTIFFENKKSNLPVSFNIDTKGFNLNDNISTENTNLEISIEKNLMDRFGITTVDPIGEEPTVTFVEPADEEPTETFAEPDDEERLLSVDEEEISLEELSDNCQIDDHHTRKCGHILYNIDSEIFTLNCFFCSTICLDLFAFSEHVKEQHNNLRSQKMENSIDTVADLNTNHSISQDRNICIETTDTMQELETEPSEITQYMNCYGEFKVDIIDGDEIPNSSSSDEDNTAESHMETENLGIDFNNRALISYFIHLLKRKPFVFWNKDHQYKKRKAALQHITELLGKKFSHLTLTYENVCSLMYKMRASYQSELKLIKVTKERRIDYVPKLWYFNKLKCFDCDFDAVVIQKKIDSLKEIAAQRPLNIYTDNMRSDNDNEEITLQIIEHYEKQSHLWNFNHPNYSVKFSDNSDKSLQEFYTFISSNYQANVEVTLKDFETALEQMHRWYEAEEKIRLDMEERNESFNSCYPRIYKALEFLRGHVPPFHCDICNKFFQSDKNFAQHKKYCNVVKECEHCHMRFATLNGLQVHARVHDEQLYPCTYCSNKYRSKKTLNHHIGRRHSGITFSCDICHRTYYSHTNLRIHQKSHLGIKDYICDLCGKGFISSKYLNTHRDYHFPEKRRKPCEHCGKTFQAAFIKSHKENCPLRKERIETKLATNQNKSSTLKKPVKKVVRKQRNKRNDN